MAVPDLRMPSFGFTEAEKVDNDGHVLSLLSQCSAFLDSYWTNTSTMALDDASFALNQAIVLAEDPDACECPSLAKCYLYKGHVLCAMDEFADARSAYLRASRMSSYSPIDGAASKQAAFLAMQMKHKIRDMKRKGGIWPPYQSVENCGARAEKAVSPYAFPPCQHVRRNRPRIIEPQRQNTPEPHGLVESDGVWTPEVISTTRRREKIRAGLRCFMKDSLARGAECLTIRAVTA
ncbi:hypothetical protein F4821DRAFT_262282 [Hypoxylon rubiginosum]|uniref:Uncharacterized protein n=1 Tax=Hypoxylon rubiginosum TaxID=110542 RepID=A0ACC0CUT4_9PEZI|nr:hypothetical protein F4821DRAFT_262282 [Hypoxylon rubiginosum]